MLGGSRGWKDAFVAGRGVGFSSQSSCCQEGPGPRAGLTRKKFSTNSTTSRWTPARSMCCGTRN